jgi:hypothetical protein
MLNVNLAFMFKTATRRLRDSDTRRGFISGFIHPDWAYPRYTIRSSAARYRTSEKNSTVPVAIPGVISYSMIIIVKNTF